MLNDVHTIFYVRMEHCENQMLAHPHWDNDKDDSEKTLQTAYEGTPLMKLELD